MPTIYTYQKRDKLKSRTQTQLLFAAGQSIANFPIRVLYTIKKDPTNIPLQGALHAGVGAPMRNFRKAVQRNRVKRLLREGYRLEKYAFVNGVQLAHTHVNLFFMYSDKIVLTQKEIQEKIKELLEKIAIKINDTK